MVEDEQQPDDRRIRAATPEEESFSLKVAATANVLWRATAIAIAACGRAAGSHRWRFRGPDPAWRPTARILAAAPE